MLSCPKQCLFGPRSVAPDAIFCGFRYAFRNFRTRKLLRKDRVLTEQEANLPAESSPPEATTARKNRGIRFSDAEWNRIENEAKKRDVSASELVRLAALESATSGTYTVPDSISPELANCIRHIDRGVFILATLKRNEMIRDGRREELDEIVQEAKRIQNDAYKKLSK